MTSATSLSSLTRSDLEAFHREHFRPNNATVLISGSVDSEEITETLEQHFGSWQRAPVPRASAGTVRSRGGREVVLVHRPGSTQSTVSVGFALPPATSADWPALDVYNTILGEGTQSWMFSTLRDARGWAYLARSSLTRRRDHGYLRATTNVRPEVADSAAAAILGQMELMAGEPLGAERLSFAKGRRAGLFPTTIDTPAKAQAQLGSYWARGQTTEDLESYREQIAAVTSEDVLRVARTHLDPARALVVVVGDATQLRAGMSRFGPVRLIAPDGSELSADQLGSR